MKISEAIKILSETYMSLDSVALGLDVSQKDVTAALAKAKEDTTEYICLQALAKKFTENTQQEVTTNDDDSEHG